MFIQKNKDPITCPEFEIRIQLRKLLSDQQFTAWAIVMPFIAKIYPAILTWSLQGIIRSYLFMAVSGICTGVDTAGLYQKQTKSSGK